MEIQSNTAASLFDGLNQSQTQGTGAKDDAFSKMMERLLSDTAARKRDQADADAAKSAAERSAAAKDAAREAREAREAKADAQRKTPVRAERPRLDTAPPLREPEQPKPAAKTDAPPVRDTAKDTVKDKAPAKTDEPARKTAAAKTDKPAGKDAAKDVTRATGDTAEACAPDADAEIAALADDGSVDESGTGGSDEQTKDEAQAEGEATVIDLTLTVTETTVQVVTPNSDTLLASLAMTAAAQTAAPGVAEPVRPTDTTAAGAASAQPAADPAAQLAAQLAQAQQAATQAAGPAAGQTADGRPADGKPAKGAVATPADGAVPADTTAEAGKSAEALPTDDEAAVPTSFADLIAAAKTKVGEKGGAKQHGAESGGRNDGQPQPQAQAVPAQTSPTPGPALESLKSAADGQAIGALAAAGPTTETAATAQTSGSHTHAALAAMEAPRAPAGVDATQTASAMMRPSRGTAGMPLGVPDQVAVHIKKNVASDVDQFTINLHPAELGRIDIKLDIGADGRVSAMVAVEKAQTLELLQKDSRGLERALQDAGLQADSNSLNFSLRGEGNPFQGENKGGGSGKRGRGAGGGGTEVDPADGAAYTVTLGNGRLDIHA